MHVGGFCEETERFCSAGYAGEGFGFGAENEDGGVEGFDESGGVGEGGFADVAGGLEEECGFGLRVTFVQEVDSV